MKLTKEQIEWYNKLLKKLRKIKNGELNLDDYMLEVAQKIAGHEMHPIEPTQPDQPDVEAVVQAVMELKYPCRICSGFGYTSEHNPDDPHRDGECSSCPVQVQCYDCRAEGSVISANEQSLRTAVASVVGVNRMDEIKRRHDLIMSEPNGIVRDTMIANLLMD
jgi:hypothetical protein